MKCERCGEDSMVLVEGKSLYYCRSCDYTTFIDLLKKSRRPRVVKNVPPPAVPSGGEQEDPDA